MHRTLTFMRGRLSRPATASNSGRRLFKVDSLLDKKVKQMEDDPRVPNGYMNVTFLGFYDKRRNFL